MELEGKYALVTGGAKGIGKSISLLLAKNGVNVAVNNKEDEESLIATACEIKAMNVDVIKMQFDVGNYSDVRKKVDVITSRFPTLDILVNNAGIRGENNKLDDIALEEWRRVIRANLEGTYNCCKACLPWLKEAKGKIVNISSIAGKMGGNRGCHYAASKAGIHGLTFSLASELAPKVTVNSVAPGPVKSGALPKELVKKLKGKTPYKRMATVEEVAHCVIFLLENDYVSGEVLDINAARYMD